MENRVTTYKVCKAIANGVPVQEKTLVLATQRPVHEVHAVLVKLYPDLFGIPGVDVPYRTTATIDELVSYARPIARRDGIESILNWQYFASACGCVGPQRGEPLCPCSMSQGLSKNREAVAAKLMEEFGFSDEQV